jgi:hypothetical protein
MHNREQWLAALAIAARPHIAGRLNNAEEAAIRLSCGFPPKTGRKAAEAAIVPPTASEDFTAEIFISPTVDDAQRVARLVLPLLAMAHGSQWRNAAPQVAPELGSLPSWAVDTLATLGAYPHARLEVEVAPKQSTRLIRAACERDSYIVRVSRATLDRLGAPICPACLNTMQVNS